MTWPWPFKQTLWLSNSSGAALLCCWFTDNISHAAWAPLSANAPLASDDSRGAGKSLGEKVCKAESRINSCSREYFLPEQSLHFVLVLSQPQDSQGFGWWVGSGMANRRWVNVSPALVGFHASKVTSHHCSFLFPRGFLSSKKMLSLTGLSSPLQVLLKLPGVLGTQFCPVTVGRRGKIR